MLWSLVMFSGPRTFQHFHYYPSNRNRNYLEQTSPFDLSRTTLLKFFRRHFGRGGNLSPDLFYLLLETSKNRANLVRKKNSSRSHPSGFVLHQQGKGLAILNSSRNAIDGWGVEYGPISRCLCIVLILRIIQSFLGNPMPSVQLGGGGFFIFIHIHSLASPLQIWLNTLPYLTGQSLPSPPHSSSIHSSSHHPDENYRRMTMEWKNGDGTEEWQWTLRNNYPINFLAPGNFWLPSQLPNYVLITKGRKLTHLLRNKQGDPDSKNWTPKKNDEVNLKALHQGSAWKIVDADGMPSGAFPCFSDALRCCWSAIIFWCPIVRGLIKEVGS